MKATLIIKDFGPIKDCQFEINKYTLLIGPQASGKSTVSKVLAVIHSFDYSLISVAGKNRQMEQLSNPPVNSLLSETIRQNSFARNSHGEK